MFKTNNYYNKFKGLNLTIEGVPLKSPVNPSNNKKQNLSRKVQVMCFLKKRGPTPQV